MRIDTDYKIDDLTLIKHLKKLDSPFLPKIQEVYNEVKDILNSRIQYVFPNYTLHNTGHSFRIMEYMSKLVSDYTKLSELEVALLVYSALLHDIGMAVSEEDVEAIKSDSFDFCEVKFSAMKKLMAGDEDLALQEYVRRIHSSLSKRFILKNLKEKFVIPQLTSLDFTMELALICESHTKSYDWIRANLRLNEVRGDYSFNPQFISCILRLADILDIDGNRTPYNLYKLISPQGVSDEEWKQHFIISNNDKILFNEKTKQKKIVFHGKAKSASIHRKLLKYIGWVKDEINGAVALVGGMPAQYSLVYDTNPEINIQTVGYTFSNYKMTLDFKAISSLLMGEKIYGGRNLGLRELIQNSIDSCRLRQESEERKYEFGADKYQPKIKVILDQVKNQAIIKDNGTGMSLEIVKNHFLNIGTSYYSSTDFLLEDYNYKPIGNFGIGFLACFMLSNWVKVVTRFYQSKNKYTIEFEKGNEFTSLTETEDYTFEGTEVILEYSSFMEVFEKKVQRVNDFLSKFFLTDGIDFELIDKFDRECIKIQNSIVSSSPLKSGIVALELQDYLNDIQGNVLLKTKGSFIKSFEDINFEGECLYRYSADDGIVEITELSKLAIDDYVNEREINFLSIPLVESHVEDEYMAGLNFTDDYVSEVIEKMDHRLKWISVLIPKEEQEFLTESEVGPEDLILGNFGFKELKKIGHSGSCVTMTFVKTIKLFEGRKNELYLPFDERGVNYSAWNNTGEERNELFIRNVLVKDFSFNIPISASLFQIQNIVVNIFSRRVIPDISRNNIDLETLKMLNSVVGKAIHLGALKILNLDKEEKLTLQNFITTFYYQKTEFER